MKTLLLTGGTGFLGSRLLEPLLEAGYQVVLLKRTFSNCSRITRQLPRVKVYDIDSVPLTQVFADQRIDIVLHCATDYGRKDIQPTRLIEANLTLPLTLLQLADKHGTQAFINTDTILDKRVSFYTLSKRQFFEWLQVFGAKLVCVNIALEHFFGPHDDPSKFVTMIVNRVLANVPEIPLTLGEQKRDFIYIDDVVAGFMAILKAAPGLEQGLHRFEIGSGETITIRDFVTRIRTLAGNTKTVLRFGALPYRENEVMESKVDLRALQALGWTPETPLNIGLQKTLDLERERCTPCDT